MTNEQQRESMPLEGVADRMLDFGAAMAANGIEAASGPGDFLRALADDMAPVFVEETYIAVVVMNGHLGTVVALGAPDVDAMPESLRTEVLVKMFEAAIAVSEHPEARSMEGDILP